MHCFIASIIHNHKSRLFIASMIHNYKSRLFIAAMIHNHKSRRLFIASMIHNHKSRLFIAAMIHNHKSRLSSLPWFTITNQDFPSLACTITNQDFPSLPFTITVTTTSWWLKVSKDANELHMTPEFLIIIVLLVPILFIYRNFIGYYSFFGGSKEDLFYIS